MTHATITPREARKELVRRRALREYPTFFRAFPPQTEDDTYLFGIHTRGVLAKLDDAIKRVEQGESVYLAINMPPRHGKSDLVSRRFPAWVLCRHSGWEIILASYNAEIARELAQESRNCLESVGGYYGVGIAKNRDRQGAWRTEQNGAIYAAGLRGTIAGRGGHVLIIDDYLKDVLDAESQTARNHVWDSFASDLMTRRAPVAAVIILAHRWGPDDLCGRIENRNNPNHEDYDPKFPKFEVLKFPAWVPEEEAEEYGYSGWLFPQRFPDEWYESLRAAMSEYQWQGKGLQNPTARTGNLLRADLVTEVENWPEGLRWMWAWDLASTPEALKSVKKGDPDYTVGTRFAWKAPDLYIDHVIRGRWSSLERRGVMQRVTERGSRLFIECVAGYKDAAYLARDWLSGVATVTACDVHANLMARAARMEPTFEGGHVYVRKGAPWLPAWRSEFLSFPHGQHDDQVASLVTGYEKVALSSGWGLSR
jgi:predicted phage terminase large subunit-like protein